MNVLIGAGMLLLVWTILSAALIARYDLIQDSITDDDTENIWAIFLLFPVFVLFLISELIRGEIAGQRDDAIKMWNLALIKALKPKGIVMLVEGPKIWVESLMTEDELKEYQRKNKAVCHSKKHIPIFECDFKWRWRMGGTLSPAEIKLINSRLDEILKKAKLEAV